MALFPQTPMPSHVSAPEIIDPAASFSTDYGYIVARPRTSRPRRRWTIDYLGMPAADVRSVRNFLYAVRMGANDFQWFHPTAAEFATFQPTTPVQVELFHGMWTGMSVAVNNSPNPSINGGVFQITISTHVTFTLNGTVAQGITGTGYIGIYVPHARVVVSQDTLPSPSTLIGPDRVMYPGEVYRGYYSFQITIEEFF
jgi:hypothetical protein